MKAIADELQQQQGYLEDEVVETIYFGGGTPSILEAGELQVILESIRQNFRLGAGLEITLEANPDDIDEALLALWKEAGINRLSIGVQAFQEELLVVWNRSHDRDQALRSMRLALEAGFENITADLIYGAPGLTDEEWIANIHQLVSLNIPHISSYALTIEPGTALHHFITKGKALSPEEEQANRQYALLQTILAESGYIQYEVSNFGKPGFASRHNRQYWTGRKYLGVGPSAHSFNGYSRQWNMANNVLYVQSIQQGVIPFEKEELTTEQQYNEIVMTGLRTSEGIDLDRIMALGDRFMTSLLDQLNALSQKRGLENAITYTAKGNPALTPSFLFFADGLASDLFLLEK